MKMTFWLLDINPQMEKDPAELWLWGIDNLGNRVVVIDRNFTAYFYAVIEEGFDPAKTASRVMNAYPKLIVKTEVAERKFFGKLVQTVKIYCAKAGELGKLAKQLRKLEGIKDCLEDDIRLSTRYLIDNNVVPCAWHEVEALEEENSGVRADKVYALTAPPKVLEIVGTPSLRILSFSLISYSREGSPKPDRNPIVIISAVTNSGEEKQFVAGEDMNDKQVIEQFKRYVQFFNPDVIASYGGNTLEWNYLRERAHRFGIKLDVDRSGIEPHTSVYGHVSLIGIANVDLADFMDLFPEIKVKTLLNLTDHLNVLLGEPGQFIESVDFPDYWDNAERREELKRFCKIQARKILSGSELLLDFAMQLSSLVSLPLDHVMTAAVGFRVESFLIKQAPKICELIPKRVEQPYRPYAGGLVLQPKAGLHENIAVLDFKSMYPNIMITYNLSPDTYVASGEVEPPSGVYEAPEVKHRFRKMPPGFFKEVLLYLIDVRNKIRLEMNEYSPGTNKYNVLDARQKAVKVITNATYGYAGWTGARWYIKPVAEAASAWGRNIILTATQMAENLGLMVVYGDTDSLFIKFDEAKAHQLQDKIKQELKLDVEIGEVYKRIFFTEAKKRYAGLKPDGTLDIVGLEVIRGDWAGVAKKVQEHVLEIILNEQSPKTAIAYVRSIIHDLKQKKIPFRDLIIWKTLTKPPEDYAIRAPHVEAAKMLKEKGWRLTSGDIVGYVILAGKGRFYNRVKPYVFAKIEEVDVDYYITNQIVPAAARILSYFGVEEEELIKQAATEKEETRSLMDFIGT